VPAKNHSSLGHRCGQEVFGVHDILSDTVHAVVSDDGGVYIMFSGLCSLYFREMWSRIARFRSTLPKRLEHCRQSLESGANNSKLVRSTHKNSTITQKK